MTLESFQQNKKLVGSARDLSKNDTFMAMFAVLQDSSPLRAPLPPRGNGPSDHSHRLGLVEGYHLAIKVLEATWTLPSKPRREIEATYPDPE